jgi:hypothetical protein
MEDFFNKAQAGLEFYNAIGKEAPTPEIARKVLIPLIYFMVRLDMDKDLFLNKDGDDINSGDYLDLANRAKIAHEFIPHVLKMISMVSMVGYGEKYKEARDTAFCIVDTHYTQMSEEAKRRGRGQI